MRISCILYIIAAMQMSCSIIPTYPAGLPALTQTDTNLELCPPIAGVYMDTGNAITPDGRLLGTVSLTRLLHPLTPESDSSKADTFIVQEGVERDLVEVESFKGQERLATWQQPKLTKEAYLSKGDRVSADHYLCLNGYVRLVRDDEAGGGGTIGLVILTFKSDFLWLRKAVDGSLIVLHTFSDYVVINFVLPVGHGDKIWYQFQPAQTL